MNLSGTRFVTEVCPNCEADLVRCSASTGEVLVNAAESDDGNMRLSDTGAARPYAQLLTTAQQFGRRGTLHRRHNCGTRRPARVAA